MPTIKKIRLIKKEKFVIIAFKRNNETFIIYLIFLNFNSNIYLLYKIQIAVLVILKDLI